MKYKSNTILAIVALGGWALAATPTAQAAMNIDMTYIGAINNAADTTVMEDSTTGYGKVDYGYYIGTNTVTNAQYATFLNSVAKSDPNGLYNTEMANIYGGITRTGSAGSYEYTIIAGRGNNAVNYVSFIDAARFSNWLTNGATAGADTENGMYTISDIGSGITRNADAWNAGGYAITSENEWYKAAYYNVAGGFYTKYATGNTITTAQANYANSVGNVTPGDEYDPEQNGTLSMMGDVWEWNESLSNDGKYGNRGGAFYDEEDSLASSTRSFSYPDLEMGFLGFRVSSIGFTPVPEPATYALLLGLGVAGVALLRRRASR